jgi:two-component system chemotaxis sensor kinase CheA
MSPNDPAETFRQEAQELLEQLEQALLDLEHAPGNSDLIDSAFRALHTIKGSGAMFGFDALVSAGPTLIAITLSAMDRMRVLLEESGPIDPGPGDMILRELKAIVDAETVTGVVTAPASMTYRIRFWLARDAMAMGTNPLFLLDELRALGSASVSALTDRVPPLDILVATDCYLGWDVVLTTEQPRAAIEDVFMFVIDGMELSIETIAPGSDPRLGEILIQRGDVPQGEVAAALSRQAPLGALLVESGAVSEVKLAAAVAEQRHVRAEAKVDKVDKGADSIRIPAAKLDELMERVGELVIAQSRLSQIAAVSAQSEVKSIAEEIERLTLALRDTTMGVRTLPIGSLFGRFRRLVHDLSRDLGKEIELVTIGEETELDKTVIERLNDPLIHLIRNSIDHGLETPEVRRAAGKPECGRITLLARHAGAEVLVSIIDDGKGLDRARIRARAEENGLLPVGVTVSDAELFQLIFEPGFSTAQEVTSLSGRGVGMDVVKRTIKSLRGKIDIESTPGVGSEISLRLPLTLAIIDGLLIRVGTQRYVLPLSAVVECVELSSEEDARSNGRNFLNIRDDLVPFLRLRHLFQTSTPADRYQKAVIVSAGDLRVGLVVDQVIGNHQTVVKSLSSLHADLKTFSGATILGDGTVALILDIVHLIELGQAQETQMRAAE